MQNAIIITRPAPEVPSMKTIYEITDGQRKYITTDCVVAAAFMQCWGALGHCEEVGFSPVPIGLTRVNPDPL